VAVGDGNVLIVSEYLMQIIETQSLEAMALNLDAFDVIVIKSRVHFRRGFDDSGFSKAIYLVEPDEAFLGTTKLNKLPYKNVVPSNYFPYGCSDFTIEPRQHEAMTG